MIVIIPCGARKRDHTALAKDLYTGPYFRACLRYARTLTSDDHIYILSGKHGLLGLNERIEPYEMTLDDPDAIGVAELLHQARARGLRENSVVAVGGRRYTALCRAVFPNCETPLNGVGGMGLQLRWMKQHAGRLA